MARVVTDLVPDSHKKDEKQGKVVFTVSMLGRAVVAGFAGVWIWLGLCKGRQLGCCTTHVD